MSVESPEASILGLQMSQALVGKLVRSYTLKDVERLQRSGLVQKDTRGFDAMIGGKVASVRSRGNTIVVKLDNAANLVLAPEYGGIVLYHDDSACVPEKYHLWVEFDDGTSLTVRQKSMGCIHAVHESQLAENYVYRRDFLGGPSPLDEEFTLEKFASLLERNDRMLKSVMIGKDAVLVGISNSTFQDVAHLSNIHPKRKASDLSPDERNSLFKAIKQVVSDRIRLGGKVDFVDFYGNAGDYHPVIDSSAGTCRTCGTTIQKLAIAGGATYFCPRCQRAR